MIRLAKLFKTALCVILFLGVVLLLAAQAAFAQADTSYARGVTFFKIRTSLPALTIVKSGNVITTGYAWLDTMVSKYNVSDLTQVFNLHPDENLKRVYRLAYPIDQDVFQVVNELTSNTDVEFAEPCCRYELFGTPNDLRFAEQWAHKKLQSELAWNLNTGNGEVIIGIVDTGIDLIHPDLTSNFWTNDDEIPNNDLTP